MDSLSQRSIRLQMLSVAELVCPLDGDLLARIVLVERGIKLESLVCGKCRHVFISGLDAGRLVGSSQFRSWCERVGGGRGAPCPRCQILMDRRSIERNYEGVPIDLCKSCGGVWLAAKNLPDFRDGLGPINAGGTDWYYAGGFSGGGAGGIGGCDGGGGGGCG